MSGRLAGKVAIITGAGAGIGRASSVAFAREGARVVCADLDEKTGEETAALAREAGTGRQVIEAARFHGVEASPSETVRLARDAGEALFLPVDAADSESVATLVRVTVSRFGRLDVFYANAGIVPGGTVLDCDEAEWERAMAVNARSVFLACRHAIPAMKAGGGGSIVCTSSVAGLVGVKNRAAYSASKMAVIGLVKSVALDFIADGIRINAICPGTVDTPSLQGRLRATGDYETALREFIARQPMGRLGTAEEIAALALYLASDESAYMTGTYVTIDGGLSL
jgi:2-keto-3-deoxy-L-fuconate dehydrogenase